MELSKELDRIDAFVLLDLLGAKNPQITHTTGHGTGKLFKGLENIGLFRDSFIKIMMFFRKESKKCWQITEITPDL